MGVTPCLLRNAPAFDKGVHSHLPTTTSVTTGLLAFQGYTGLQVGMNDYVFFLAYADDFVLLSHSYSLTQLTNTPQKSACAVTLRKLKLRLHSSLVCSAKEDVDQFQVFGFEGRCKWPRLERDQK